MVAPYDSDTETALAHCFDRRTGKAVPSSVLASYREVLADYHLHSESKFHNGELYDRGTTERVHFEVISVEYIGKETHRLEEQFFLGEMPGAQIEYGHHPEGHVRLIAVLVEAAKVYGMERLANEANLSRQQLHAVIYCEAQPKRPTLIRLCRTLRTLISPVLHANYRN